MSGNVYYSHITGDVYGNVWKYKWTPTNSFSPETVGIKLYVIVIFKGYSAFIEMQQTYTEHLLYYYIVQLIFP